MNRYLDMLNHSYAKILEWREGIDTRAEYLAAHIFHFTTYDGDLDELFVRRAVEVCEAIGNRTTFDYIRESDNNYQWYIAMCHMPFFAERLEWGTSIRGAWWDHKDMVLDSCGLYDGERQITEELHLAREEWLEFIEAVVAFYKQEEQ